MNSTQPTETENANHLPPGYSVRFNPWRDTWGFTVSLYRGDEFVRVFNDEGDAIRAAIADGATK